MSRNETEQRRMKIKARNFLLRELSKSSREPAGYVESEKSLMRMMELTESNQVGMDEYLTEPAMAELCQDILLIGLAMSTGNICPYIAGNTTVSCEIDYEYST